jgi:phosphoadenosine phosphosulfate reductase
MSASKPVVKTNRLCGGPSAQFDAKLAATQAQLAVIAAEGNCVLASSLGAEDMVLLDLISTLATPDSAKSSHPISAFVIDTGRLHDHTLQLLATVQRSYTIPLAVLKPRDYAVQDYVRDHGLDAIYTSVELRKACCHIRKTEPLQRALEGKTGWITGLRRTQSITRADIAVREWDATHGLWKFNPLLEWTEGDVWHYIDSRAVAYNPLHDQGMPSIGCAPCTRAITPGEDVRAGRWWWENPESKECGLHVAGKPRASSVSSVSSASTTTSVIPIREATAP